MVDIYSKINECKAKGLDAVIVTVTEKEGMGPTDVGKKLIYTQSGEFFGTIGGGAIEHFAIEKCKSVIKERSSFTERYVLNDKVIKVDDGEVLLKMACGGKCTLFYEFIGPKESVFIFGAGHCGAALARILNKLDFFVTIIDSRKELIDNLDESANIKVCEDFAKYIETADLNNKFVVVSTPSHIHDFEVMDKIFELKMKPRYFGMLCSTKKMNDYLGRIKEKYGEDLDLTNLYSPIGLNVGGDSPEEVAVSIASEILSIHYGKEKDNFHMREKNNIKYWEK